MGNPINVSVSEQLATYCSEKGLGSMGELIFVHGFPANDDKYKTMLVFMDTRNGQLNRGLAGNSTCQHEFFQVIAKADTEKNARILLEPVFGLLDNLTRVQIGNSFYMRVGAIQPIHFVGFDKNQFAICEIDFMVLRRPV